MTNVTEADLYELGGAYYNVAADVRYSHKADIDDLPVDIRF
jgi:hypothetical protein